MAISRMQEPRQLYGLGSLVKKATRGIKKIAKSPIGKAALFAAGAYGLGALGAAGKGGFLKQLAAGRSNFGLQNILSGAGRLAFGLKDGKGLAGQGLFGTKGAFSPKRSFLTAGLAASALPFFMGGEEEVEEVDMLDPVAVRQRAVDFYRQNQTPEESGLFFMPDKRFVSPNFYAAEGGLANLGNRVGFFKGALASGEDISPGTDVKGNIRNDNPFTGDKGDTPIFTPSINEPTLVADALTLPTEGQGKFNLMQLKKLKDAGYDPDEVEEGGYGEDLIRALELDPFVAADGGRAGYAKGKSVIDEEDEEDVSSFGMYRKMPKTFLNMGGDAGNQQAQQVLMMEYVKYKNKGGDMSFEQFVKAVMQQAAPEGAGMEQPRAMAQDGGIMNTEEAEELIDMGGMEKDYRNEGGFVAIGGKERADDVPARLSKNEFVFTADAVRNAGGGDIDKGAEVMENLMKNLEEGGEVSEDSQGLEGAQRMYEQQQMLQSRVI